MNFDNPLVSKIDSNEIEDKNKSKYKSWIPNNSGYIRPNLIGLSQSKDTRFRVNHGNDKNTFNITVINYSLDLKDDLPSYIDTLKNVYKRCVGNLTNNAKTKKIIKEYGYLKNDDEQIFINNIKLVDNIKNETPNLLDKKHLLTDNYKDAGYIGKAYLCSLTPNDFKKFLKFNEVSKLKKLNSKITLDQDDIDNNFKEFSNYFSKNNSNFIYAFSVEYKIELKGLITLSNLKIVKNIKKEINLINSFNQEDEQVEVMQQLFTLIKMDIHGDSHHHYKSDTILKIVPIDEFNKETTILNQITHFIKILDKVEQKRKTLPCSNLIPSFKFDAEGVNCYANVYKKLYLEKTEKDKITTFEDDILKSIKTLNDRNEESIKLVNKAKSAYFDFLKSLVPFAILIVGFLSLLFNQNFSNLKSENDIMLTRFKDTIFSIVSFILEHNIFALAILIFIFLFQSIKIKFCYKRYLFKDARPRDMSAVKLLYLYHNKEISFIRKHLRILLGTIGLVSALIYFNYYSIISYIKILIYYCLSLI